LGKELLWQRSYSAYLIKLKKQNHGEFFTDTELETQQSLVVPIQHEDGEGDCPEEESKQEELKEEVPAAAAATT